jgi:O-antigen/teichoic acid export membrane protein
VAHPGLEPIPPESPPVRRRGLGGLVLKLAAVNTVALAAGIVTGPLQAHALGADGRGALAAILVPATLAAWLLSFGLGDYTAREAARGTEPRVLLGSMGALSLLAGVAGAAIGIPLSSFLAGGRHVVQIMLLFAFATLPIALLQQIVFQMALGQARYRTVSIGRLIPPLASLVGVAVLFALGKLTVGTAAVVAFGGGLLSTLPLLGLIRDAGRPVFSKAVALGGLRFGVRAWTGGISNVVNGRLDQLLMVRLVSERELGLYAIAVTLAGFTSIATSSLAGATLPRVARGEADLVRRTLRVTLWFLAVSSVVVAAATPILLPIMFGAEFAAARDMVWILLAASVPLTGISVLGPALLNSGHPGTQSAAAAIGMVITVVALPFALPALGGLGAALVSLVAYSVSFAFLLMKVRSLLGGRLDEYLMPKRQDLSWFRDMLTIGLRRVRHAVARPRRG